MTIMTPDFGMADAVRAARGGDRAPRATTGTANADGIAGDAQLYLRHVEGGESIRAIARDAGCHASTILRRIRRFENRRDDPLVDTALRNLAADGTAPRGTRSPDQSRRVLRRLAEPGAELVVAPGLAKAIVSRDEIRTAILDRDLAERMALDRWVEQVSQSTRISRYRLSAAGRAELRRLSHGGPPRPADFADARPVGQEQPEQPGMAEAAAGFDHADRHRVWGERSLPDTEDGKPRRMRVNLAESPLQLLARRRDAQGNAFLPPDLVAAGEQLREDFELAQMGPRVAQNWDRFMTAGIDEGGRRDRMGGGSDRARARVSEALRELGPGMGDLVLQVCCFLEGLEMTERRLGWAARSGKVVLKLALERLARHYLQRYGAGGPLIG